MDRRFWQGKRMIPWLNISQEVCPAYQPITFSWDNDSHNPSPWTVDKTLLSGGRLALPIAFGCMAETGYADALYAINGPFDVQPGSYGECSIDYPLPILYDPDSFPIPDPESPGAPPEPGTWQEYLEFYTGDIEGPPLLGFIAADGPEVGWQPASFMADFILWSVLYWLPNADGSNSKNLALVVPAGPVDSIPTGGAINVGSDEALVFEESGVPQEILDTEGETLIIPQAGLYQLSFNAQLSIQAESVAATVTLKVTFGDGWFDAATGDSLAGTPQANQAVASFGQVPVPGETLTLLSAGLKVPTVTVASNNDYTLMAGAVPVTGSLGSFGVEYSDWGFGNVQANGFFYLLPGDEITMQIMTTGNDDAVTVEIAGGLAWFKQSSNPFGTFPILY